MAASGIVVPIPYGLAFFELMFCSLAPDIQSLFEQEGWKSLIEGIRSVGFSFLLRSWPSPVSLPCQPSPVIQSA
jgi:hypothetical protein